MNIFRGLAALPEFHNSVVTIGSFDGVHAGHLKILKRIQQLAESVGGTDVVVTFHPHPREIVYPKDNDLRLLTTLDEKLEYFRQSGVSNVVIIPFTIEFSHQSAQEYIERFLVDKFRPRYVVIGYDHRFGINRTGDVHLLRIYGRDHQFEVVEIAEEEIRDITISSTRIRRALQGNNLELATSLLGHPYMIKGTVVTGNRLGHHIGYPTANLRIPDAKKLLPRDGIYAASLVLDGLTYPGMLYLGLRPSIDSVPEHRVEIHVFDFDKQIYGREVMIEVHQFIRADQKFGAMEDLRAAMQADEQAVRGYFKGLSADLPEVATVILNYNGRNLLERFLPHFKSSRYDREKLYVADNASTDGSVRFLRAEHPDVHVIPMKSNKGYAGGYNEALEQIESPYCALVNSDIEVTPDWLIPIIRMMEEDPTIAAVQPRILSETQRGWFEYAGAAGGMIDSLGYPFCRGRVLSKVERDAGQYEEPIPIFWASGAAFVIRTEVFRAIGGFDTDYFAHQEEIDLSWRIHLKGYKVYNCPQSVVYHIGGGTLSYNTPRKIYLNFRNNIITTVKYLPQGDLIPIVSLRWVLDALAGLRFILKGQPANALAVLRSHYYIYGHLRQLIQKRRDHKARFDRLPLSKLPGVFEGSIIFEYYFRARRTYQDLFRS